MSQMRTDILGHPPGLCNCRRVWHPAIPTLPSRGCSGLHCTNQAAIASSHRIHRTHRNLLQKCTPTEFTEFSCRGELLCILRVPWDNIRNLNICAICGRIIKWVAWVWQGCHTLLSVFCGTTLRTACLVGAAETAAPPERTSVHSVPRLLKN